MEDKYVQKETFDEVIRRMEAMNSASEARTAALIADNNARLEVYRADSRREAESLASDIRAIKDMLSLMNSRSAVWQGLLGFVFGLCAVIIAGVQVYLAVKGG